MGLIFSEKVDGGESSGTSYKCRSSSVVDVTSVEGLGASVVSVRLSLPILVVVEVVTNLDGLLVLDVHDLLEDGPIDSLGARWGSHGTFVGPVGAVGHRAEELGEGHVRDRPAGSSLELFIGFLSRVVVVFACGLLRSVSNGTLNAEGCDEVVLHSASSSSVKEDGDTSAFHLRTTTLLLEHELELHVVGDTVNGMLGGRSDHSLVRSVLGVQAFGVDDIELAGCANVEGHVVAGFLHGSGGDVFETLGADSKLGVLGGKSRVEVNRRLVITGLAGQRPVVAVASIVDHGAGESLVRRIVEFGFFDSVVLFIFIGGGKGSKE
jgi:hypothetical protein